MDFKEYEKLQNAEQLFASQFSALEAIQKLEDKGDVFRSGRKVKSNYSLWDDKREGSPSLVSRLQEFNNGKRGLRFIPSGDSILLRQSVALEIANSRAVMELQQKIKSGNLAAGFGVSIMDGIVDEIRLDYDAEGSGFPLFDREGTFKDGLTKSQLQVYLAACNSNTEEWRRKGSVGPLENYKPNIVVSAGGQVWSPNMSAGVDVMKNNKVI